MDFLCSYGEVDLVCNVICNGIYVVIEKYLDFYMFNLVVGYSYIYECWVVWIFNNGEFIYVNFMSVGV